MIKHTGTGWTLYSSDGSRRLGGPYKTKDLVLKRERQVQYFKHVKGWKGQSHRHRLAAKGIRTGRKKKTDWKIIVYKVILAVTMIGQTLWGALA